MDHDLPATFPDWLSRHAEQRGPQIALRQKLRGIWASWSWRALDDEVSRIAQALGARGLVHGDHLLIHSDPGELCPELIVLGLAAQRGGAAVAFVQTAARGEPSEPSSMQAALWPRFRVVRDAAALAELPAEPAPAFELRVLLNPRGFVPGALPGVVSAGATTTIPLVGSGSTQPFTIEGRPESVVAEQPMALTRYISPGWRMAADITASLRALNPDDPVRFDFSLCHVGMMSACGYGRKQGDSQCPLRGLCHPRVARRG